MKLKVWKDKKKDERKYLHLSEQTDGGVLLDMVDDDGDYIVCSTLLEICTDGTISKIYGVGNDLGFKLDAKRRVIIT